MYGSTTTCDLFYGVHIHQPAPVFFILIVEVSLFLRRALSLSLTVAGKTWYLAIDKSLDILTPRIVQSCMRLGGKQRQLFPTCCEARRALNVAACASGECSSADGLARLFSPFSVFCFSASSAVRGIPKRGDTPDAANRGVLPLAYCGLRALVSILFGFCAERSAISSSGSRSSERSPKSATLPNIFEDLRVAAT